MPVYEFECPRCHKKYEIYKRIDEPKNGICPVCKVSLLRIYNTVPVIFKGSGFYITDSREEAKKREEEKKSPQKEKNKKKENKD